MSQLEAITDALQQSMLGKVIRREILQAIAPRTRWKSWESGTILFEEGDIANGFYVLVKGVVRLVRYRNDGKEILVHFSQAPDIFAEAAIFLGKFPVTAITDCDCELLFIPRDVVMEHLAAEPEFSKYLMRMMAVWLERLVAKMDTVIQNDATSRVIRFLLEQRGPAKLGTDPVEISIPIRKGDIARQLNMNQATFSRTLHKLQEEKLIEVKGRVFRLLNPEQMQALLLPPLE